MTVERTAHRPSLAMTAQQESCLARRANLPHPDGHCLFPQIRAIIRAFRVRKRGASRSSRTLGRDAMDAIDHETNDFIADGEVVWSWRPDAGAKSAKTHSASCG